jgi:hypothetical protein
MATWALVLPADRYESERLFANETVELPGPGAELGDTALLLAEGDTGLMLFGLGRVRSAPGGGAAGVSGGGAAGVTGGGAPVVAYTHRLIDDPVPADGLDLGGPGLHPIEPATFEAYAGKVGSELRVDASKRTWLVSVDLPIEAYSAPEAVRAFWSYVYELGPRELPAFVAPSDDELAMQAFVLGAEASLDPEDDD